MANKDIKFLNNKVTITKEVVEDYDKQAVVKRLDIIKKQKEIIKKQNARMVAEYNELTIEITQLEGYLKQFPMEEDTIEKIVTPEEII